jgi:hypothetical protein
VYPVLRVWLQVCVGPAHQTAEAALAHLVTALLIGQSLRPSALMRALVSPQPVPARQRYRRVARAWTRPWLSPGWLTPRLVQAARTLVPGEQRLVLDSVRCGRWEVFTVGLLWHGRVLPVSWLALPYPWPKKQFTPSVCRLLGQVAAAWPAGAPAPHLLADRAFGSQRLFTTLAGWGWGWTVRLRATLELTVAGERQALRERIRQSPPAQWTATPALYGRGRAAVAATLVIGRGLPVLPGHQRGPASLRARERQAAQHDRDLVTKHRRGVRRPVPETDRWIVLFTTHAHWRPAVTDYRRRWATEGTYRDGQGGWDGRHGWDLESTVARARTGAQVEAIVGLWALGTLIQSWVGDQVGAPSAPPAVQAIVQQWTTSGRLSVWARGQFAWREPSGALRPWLLDTLQAGAARLAAARLSPPLARQAGPPAVSDQAA